MGEGLCRHAWPGLGWAERGSASPVCCVALHNNVLHRGSCGACFALSKTRHEGEVLHTEIGEVLAKAAQKGCGAPSLETLKARLDGALRSLSWWGAALPMAGCGAG